MDVANRQIVGQFVGKRDQTGAIELRDSFPAVYRQCAVCYTDVWEAYNQVLPSKRHRSVAKNSGKTHHIERFNNMLRQRLARLGRKNLSFSK